MQVLSYFRRVIASTRFEIGINVTKLQVFLFGALFGSTLVMLLMELSYERIPVSVKPAPELSGPVNSSVKILCWITTMPPNHGTKAIHIKATWAPRCDRYLFMSSVDIPELPAVAAVNREGRSYLWEKTAFALKYVWTHFGEEFDFFYKADDDTYALIDNLRLLLASHDPHTPVLMGQVHKSFIEQGYPSGGAGYVMSQAALRLIVQGMKNTTMCYDQRFSFAEDLKLGACAAALGIQLIHSVDENGHSHFYCYSPFERLKNYGLSAELTFGNHKEGAGCCANNPVSFHYIKPEELYFLDYLLYTARSREQF
ncbi:Glycoprotein-N-acetylgalactosamine 3-beta-galactosyltransferase 1 [Clonorchis sinensis]|uniref:N-acetylgalactosaminide beta-1,3-galactosyltransferase n=1 Tax=Clonorchis sinensis TaxID=79923 RepID=A0A419Q1F2_CLOSI|nr:Glycoprotein-N-acetylgalactosamine 3-beta-galactosyltransferase 1 [Clonorchis sinensis]